MEQKDVLIEEELYTPVLASKGKRFANYIIDTIVFMVLYVPVMLLFGIGGMDPEGGGSILLLYLIIYGIWVGYYTFTEYQWGKSVGKMITKCKVVDDATGGKPTLRQAFLRSLSRLVPFEAFSLLFRDKAWHDTWLDTSVVEDVPAV